MNTPTVQDPTALFDSLGLSRKPPAQTGPGNQLQQQDFIKLMVTELNHQDPFKPMDNAEMAAQFANFATVNGIQGLNDTLGGMQDAFTSSQALQAATLVGKRVVVPGDTGVLPAGGALEGKATLEQSSGQVQVRISDPSGALVRVLDLGAQSAGDVSFQWDGLTDDGQTAPPGPYRVQVVAQYDGRSQGLPVQIAAPVESVELAGPGHPLKVNVEGLGPIDFSDISAIA